VILSHYFQFFVNLGSLVALHRPKRYVNSVYSLFGFRQSQLYFSNVFCYYYYIPTACFGPYGPSSGGIYLYVYWLLPKELFFYSGSAVLVLVINCLFILVFCFGHFFAAVNMCVVDMIAYYYIFQYYGISLKFINGCVLCSYLFY
jgi:hypothetical protein